MRSAFGDARRNVDRGNPQGAVAVHVEEGSLQFAPFEDKGLSHLISAAIRPNNCKQEGQAIACRNLELIANVAWRAELAEFQGKHVSKLFLYK
jgi:hypothetical protein